MADVLFKTATFTKRSGVGFQDCVIPGSMGGANPKAAIVIMTAGLPNAQGPDMDASFGFTDGTNQEAIYSGALNAVAVAQTRRYHNTSGLAEISSDAVQLCKGDFDSWLADGIRINWSIQNALKDLGQAFTVILIGGADVTNVKVGNQTMSTSGNTAVNVGFEPDLTFVVTAINIVNFASANMLPSFGVAVNDGLDSGAFTTYGVVEDNTNQAMSATLSNDACVGRAFDGNGYRLKASLYTPTGFSFVPVSGAASAYPAGYLAIKFAGNPDIKLFDVTIPDTGNYSETGAGFTPSFGYISCLSLLQSRNTIENAGAGGVSFTAFDDAEISSQTASNLSAIATSVCYSKSSDTGLLVSNPDSTDAAVSSANTFTSSGWDFTLSTNPNAPLLGFGLAIGPGGAPPVGVKEMYIKDGGIFVKYTPHVKVGGTFQEVDAYVLEGGAWVPVHEK